MQYKIIRKPFMLLETVSMLHKFVNGIKIEDEVQRTSKPMNEERRQIKLRRARRMQQIVDQVCADVDRNDPEMQRFFGRVECGCEHTCLATILTFSFCTLEHPEFRDQVEAICKLWDDLQQKGCWVTSKSSVALMFSNTLDCPGDLVRQIKGLNYSGDFRVELIDALTHFHETMHQLASLIEPLSLRLEQVFRDEPQLLDDLWNYWEQTTRELPVDRLLKQLNMNAEAEDVEELTWLAATFMNTNIVVGVGAKNSLWGLEHNILLVGSLVTMESVTIRGSTDLDGISALLKCLADRKRLEILRLLAKEKSYGLALAESIGMDPGQVSRSLGMMYNYGFLRQERESLRNYYMTDRQSIHEFLMRVEDSIFS